MKTLLILILATGALAAQSGTVNCSTLGVYTQCGVDLQPRPVPQPYVPVPLMGRPIALPSLISPDLLTLLLLAKSQPVQSSQPLATDTQGLAAQFPRSHLAKAERDMRKGRFRQAILEYTQSLAINPAFRRIIEPRIADAVAALAK